MAKVYTMRDILKALANKVSEPETEGLAGQHLDTDGNGGRFWSGTGQTVAAQKLRIGGEDYTVRTGASGEAGYLTIGANAIWLGTHQVLLDLNGKGILKMWKGASIAYERDAATATLFDHGYADGIAWSGNLLNRPQYTSIGKYDLSYVDSDGFMRLYITADTGYSSVNHNAHVCTTNFVSIPANATRMKVEVRNPVSFANTTYVKFGLLPEVYADAMDDSQGGKLSELTAVGYSSESSVLSLTLPAGFAGTDIYRAIVNIRANGKGSEYPTIYIYKVWFE